MENQIVIYKTENGQTSIEVRMENETVWLSTSQMFLLFDREESNLRRHIINVFEEGELPRENNVHFLHVNGVKKPVPFYSLDVIISVGYRVKSQCSVQFRQWANRVLKAYYILLPRTTRSAMATNALLRLFFFGFLTTMVFFTERTVVSALPITPLSL